MTPFARRHRLAILLLAAAPSALASTGCASENREWSDAQRAGTRSAYTAFLRAYPTGDHARQARQAIEDADWQDARNADSSAAYAEFIGAHPDSPRRQEAHLRQEYREVAANGVRQDMVAFASRAGETLPADVRSDLENRLWQSAQAENRRDVFKQFSELFPSSPHASEADRLAADFEFDVVSAGPSKNQCIDKSSQSPIAGFIIKATARANGVRLDWRPANSAVVLRDATRVPIRAVMPLQTLGWKIRNAEYTSLAVCGGGGGVTVPGSPREWGVVGENTLDVRKPPLGITFVFDKAGYMTFGVFYDAVFADIDTLILPGGAVLRPTAWERHK